MALEGLKGLFQEDELAVARGSDVTLGDYILDLPKGVVKGGSQAIQGLLQLGALPVDYLADTNLLSNIENLFEKITPDTKTAIGDITSVLTQFGVPAGAALKIAGGISKLKNVSQMTKLSSPNLSTSAKGVELVKRAGYFGTIGGITDFAVSTPGTISTLSEDLGLIEKTDLEGLEGRERAAEVLKSKVKFGAEGTVLGAGVTLLPIAGTLGFKYGIVPGAQAVGYVGDKVLRAVNYPVQKGIETLVGSGETSILQKTFKSILEEGGLIDKGLKKIGIDDSEWRYIPVEGGFMSEVKRGLTRIQDQFTSPGPVRPEVKQIQIDFNNKLAAEQKTLTDIGTKLENNYKDIVNNFKINLFDKGESKLIIQHESNKINDYLKATDDNTKKEILNTINKEVRNDVIKLDKLVVSSQERYNKFIKDVDFKGAQALDYNTYVNQRLAAFNNERFKYNPLLETKAVEFFKKRYETGILRDQAISMTQKQLGEKIKPTQEVFKNTLEKNIDKLAKNEMLEIKSLAIQANRNPSTIFKGVSERVLGKEAVKEGQELPDVIRKLFSVEDAALGAKIKDPITGKMIIKDIETTDFVNAAVDTVIEQSKQIYGRRAFDSFLEIGKDSFNKPGFIFTKEDLIRKGLLNNPRLFNNLKNIASRETRKLDLSELATTSDLFNGQYFAAPEIADALIGAKEITDSLYSIPFYKSFMTLKAGAQISKTILSPVTQIRNFTTASVFPLANGLIGQNISFRDGFKLVAEDIFAGAKTDLEKIGKIERLIERGVIDQNIQIQEMKRVLDRARDGKISFNKLMNTPIMKKFTDIYQGADNVWKIYTDTAYQGALRTAFGNPDDIIRMANGSKKEALETKFFNDVKDWYKTVAKEEFNPINSLTGQRKTVTEALEDISSYLTVNTVPTYSKVPKIIENIRNLPLGNFIAFPAEILRTTSNIISIGARELTSTNPFIRQMGARRLVGVTTVLGGLGTVAQKTAQYMTGVNEDQMNSFQRSFAPQYQKNSTLIPISAPDANGNFKYYNFSYSNPYDSLVTPVNAILNSFSDGSLNKDSVDNIVMTSLFGGILGGDGRKGAITEFISPFVTESIGTERAVDVTLRGGKTQDGKTIFYPQDNASVRIAKSLDHVIGGLTPGAVTSAQRVWQGATGKFTDYGTRRDGTAEFAALLSGVRVDEAKPLASMPFIVTSFNDDKKNIRSKFAKDVYNAASSPESKLAAYKTYLIESFQSQRNMYNTLNDARNLGISKSKLSNLLEDRLTKVETDTLLNGRLKVPSYSKDAFEALSERLKKEDPIAAVKIKRQNDALQSIFDSLYKRLERIKLDIPVDQLDNYIEDLLSPRVKTFRKEPVQGLIPTTGGQTTAPVQLPTNITYSSNQQPTVVAEAPTLGQRYLTDAGILGPDYAYLQQRKQGVV
jgi:predicted DNA-binding protein (UPF0251 family)